jgi:hypothetical protein
VDPGIGRLGPDGAVAAIGGRSERSEGLREASATAAAEKRRRRAEPCDTRRSRRGPPTRGLALPPASAGARAPRPAQAPPPEGPRARAAADRAGPLGPPPSARLWRAQTSPTRCHDGRVQDLTGFSATNQPTLATSHSRRRMDTVSPCSSGGGSRSTLRSRPGRPRCSRQGRPPFPSRRSRSRVQLAPPSIPFASRVRCLAALVACRRTTALGLRSLAGRPVERTLLPLDGERERVLLVVSPDPPSSRASRSPLA